MYDFNNKGEGNINDIKIIITVIEQKKYKVKHQTFCHVPNKNVLYHKLEYRTYLNISSPCVNLVCLRDYEDNMKSYKFKKKTTSSTMSLIFVINIIIHCLTNVSLICSAPSFDWLLLHPFIGMLLIAKSKIHTHFSTISLPKLPTLKTINCCIPIILVNTTCFFFFLLY